MMKNRKDLKNKRTKEQKSKRSKEQKIKIISKKIENENKNLSNDANLFVDNFCPC